jgi:hypothetical protein
MLLGGVGRFSVRFVKIDKILLKNNALMALTTRQSGGFLS